MISVNRIVSMNIGCAAKFVVQLHLVYLGCIARIELGEKTSNFYITVFSLLRITNRLDRGNFGKTFVVNSGLFAKTLFSFVFLVFFENIALRAHTTKEDS